MTPIHKNKCYEIPIHDLGRNGEGVGKVGNFVVYVPGAVPGDLVSAKILKLKKRYAFGKTETILTPSPDRIPAPCPIATRCGGCQIQTLDYPTQINWKTTHLTEVMKRIGGVDQSVSKCHNMKAPFHYRNKAQFAFGRHNNELLLGLYARGSHRVIDTESCAIQHHLINRVLEANRRFFKDQAPHVYDEVEHSGLLRHLLIRASFKHNTALVALVINSSDYEHAEKWAKAMQSIEGVTGVFLNHNTARGDTILGEEMTHLSGEINLKETIGNLDFSISPKAFFQINPTQTEVLYQTVKRFLPEESVGVLWDLYCGTGSIGLFLADHVDALVGIESNPDAVKDAIDNAQRNGISNATFHLGKAEELMTDTFLDSLPQPSSVVLDPPRKGCERAVLEQVAKRSPETIIYVSCDPGTLARDTKILSDLGYTLDKLEAVDMFPHTIHLESVARFLRKS